MKVLVPIFAIAAITTLEAIAILHGIDGKLLTISVAAISGLGGYNLANIIKKK